MNFNPGGFNVNPFSPIPQHPSFNPAPNISLNPPAFMPNTVVNPLSPVNSFNPVVGPSFNHQHQSLNCQPDKFIGKVLTDPFGGYKGECVSFVKVMETNSIIPYFILCLFSNFIVLFKVCTSDNRPTVEWVEGPKVRGNTNIQPGTPIAIFHDGKYRGTHAAIYEGQDEKGIHVVDQWAERPGRDAQPVHRRTIRWDGTGSNCGNSFNIIK